jgi:cyclophilin family peptidyl-prolyl cis-trans isomerase
VSRKSNPSSHPTPFVENLEDRILMARAARPINILSAFFDNRGNVQLNMSGSIDATTLSRKTAALWLAGTDGNFGTPDDVRLYTAVGYRRGLITMRAATTLNQRYRVLLNASVIKGVNGLNLDGEFNGDGHVSGDGFAGGNFDIVTNNAAKTRARFTTDAGYITVALYKNTPNTKANFVTYANEAAYDSSVFHRTQKKANQQGIDIVQGGGFKINVAANTTSKITEHPQINNEGTNLNTTGTIAMANAGVNTNTSQFFFNVTNNTSGLDGTHGSFTVFGVVADAASQATLNALLAFPTTGTVAYPLAGQGGNLDVPIKSIPAINQRGSFSPKDDLIIIGRVAMLMDPTATPVTGVQRSLTTTQQTTTDSSTIQGTYTAATNPFLAVKDEKNALLE